MTDLHRIFNTEPEKKKSRSRPLGQGRRGLYGLMIRFYARFQKNFGKAQQKRKKIIVWQILIIILLGLMVLQAKPGSLVFAQNNWSSPQRIPGYSLDTSPPYLIADTNKTVHAFTSQWEGKENQQLAIIYSQWTLDSGWTLPVDIILSPVKEARIMGVFLDEIGLFHVIFFGGEEPSGDLYYTQALAIQASQTSAWTPPKLIGRSAIIPDSAAITGDNQGHLYVVYGGKLNNRMGEFFIQSSDHGFNWTEPSPMYTANNPDVSPYGIRLSLGQSGLVHAVWYLVDNLGHNISAYYNHFDPKTGQWGSATGLAEGYGINEGMGISNIEVIEYQGKVFVIYNNGIPPEGVPPAQWVLVSNDLGKTWDKPYRPFPQHVGRSGVVSLLVDSAGKLHFLFADRVPIFKNGLYSAIGGLFHSTWISSSNWSGPETVFDTSQGIDVDKGIIGPYDIRSVISQGNILLSTWRSDPGGDHLSVWFSYLVLNTPSIPVKPLPNVVQFTSSPIPTPIASTQTATQAIIKGTEPVSTPFPVIEIQPIGNSSLGIILGIIVAGLFVVVFVIFRMRSLFMRR